MAHTRRTLEPTSDHGDQPIPTDRETDLIWAIGKLARNGRNLEPSFHHTYPKNHVKIHFGKADPVNTCIPFTKDNRKPKQKESWGPFR